MSGPGDDAPHAAELALARAASRGERAAIDELERDHGGVIDGLCARFAGPAHTVDDLRQIVREHLLVGARPKLAEYAGQGRLDGWLRVTVVRVLVDLERRKDRAREAPTDEGEPAVPDPEDLALELVKAEYRAAVVEALRDATARISLSDRHVLHQHYVAKLSLDQLAAALGIHRATASRRATKAREALVELTRSLLAERLRLPPGEIDHVIGLVMSRLDVSLPRLLGGPRDD